MDFQTIIDPSSNEESHIEWQKKYDNRMLEELIEEYSAYLKTIKTNQLSGKTIGALVLSIAKSHSLNDVVSILCGAENRLLGSNEINEFRIELVFSYLKVYLIERKFWQSDCSESLTLLIEILDKCHIRKEESLRFFNVIIFNLVYDAKKQKDMMVFIKKSIGVYYFGGLFDKKENPWYNMWVDNQRPVRVWWNLLKNNGNYFT